MHTEGENLSSAGPLPKQPQSLGLGQLKSAARNSSLVSHMPFSVGFPRTLAGNWIRSAASGAGVVRDGLSVIPAQKF